jgi:hypothetical protein
MNEEGLLNMEVSSKHKQGRVQTKPFGRVLQIQPIGALDQNVNLGMILICKRDHN